MKAKIFLLSLALLSALMAPALADSTSTLGSRGPAGERFKKALERSDKKRDSVYDIMKQRREQDSQEREQTYDRLRDEDFSSEWRDRSWKDRTAARKESSDRRKNARKRLEQRAERAHDLRRYNE